MCARGKMTGTVLSVIGPHYLHLARASRAVSILWGSPESSAYAPPLYWRFLDTPFLTWIHFKGGAVSWRQPGEDVVLLDQSVLVDMSTPIVEATLFHWQEWISNKEQYVGASQRVQMFFQWSVLYFITKK